MLKEAKGPKVNKKSMQILQQRQERLEAQRIKEQLDKEAIDHESQQYPMTSRLKRPTSLSTRNSSVSKIQNVNSGSMISSKKNLDPI